MKLTILTSIFKLKYLLLNLVEHTIIMNLLIEIEPHIL